MKGRFGVLNPHAKWKKGDLPFDPTVVLVLNEWGTLDNGLISLSAQLATDSEIDDAVDALISDARAAGKKAKQVLKEQRERVASSARGESS